MKTNFVFLLTRRSFRRRSNQAGQDNRRARTPNGRARVLIFMGLVLTAATLLGHIGGLSTSASKGIGQRSEAGPQLPSTAGQQQGRILWRPC